MPALTVSSDIYGTAYTHAKSTLKEQFGVTVDHDPGTRAVLALHLDGLRDSKRLGWPPPPGT